MLKVVNLKKYYGKTRAVDGVTFELKRKDEFFSLLGPSGCGKTTTLRIIAGLIKPDEGRVYFRDEDITEVPVEKREVGFVFQSYALFPHMTVFENVAFGLKLKKLPEKEIRKRVKEALELVGLRGLEGRYPRQLSGGQQQRVAIARAIAVHPKMLLFDEPLSNLDAKLRERVRFELVELQKKLKIPAIYVTHDQAEALVISDRIAVMNRGRIEQIGTPYEIYKRPKTPFVADFIGISNFLEGRVVKVDNEKSTATVEIKEGISLEGFLSRNVHKGSKAIISIRPENITLAQKEGVNVVEPKVVKKTFLGDSYDYRLVLGDIKLRMKTGPEVELEVGRIVKVELKECIVFPKERR